MPTVLTDTRATANFATSQQKLSFADGIALLDPNQNPFTLITMRLGKGVSGDIAHNWLEDELQPEHDQLNALEGLGDTSIVVDNGARFSPGDLVKHNQTGEIMLVASISANTLTVDRDYGEAGTPGYTALAHQLDDNDYLTIIGNAFEQGASLPEEKSVVAIKRTNYCQDIRTPFGVTEIASAASVYGENDWTWQMKKAGMTHQRKIEGACLWGVPEIGVNTLSAGVDTQPPTCGGIRWFINEYGGADRNVTQAEITQTEFLDFIEAGFEYGSANKVMFCSPVLRTALDYWGITKLQTFSEKTVFGMKVATWVSAHGTITFVTHKMLKEPGSDGAYNFLLDMENIKWIDYSNIGATRLRHLNVYEATGETSKKAEYQTIGCMEFKLAKTHAMLKGVTSYAA